MTYRMQTPYFLIEKNAVDVQLEQLKKALHDYWPNSIIGYSYKTNALPWIVDYFDKKGCYAEVVSCDEYGLGKYIGVKPDHFVYNGPIKTKESFLEALENGSYVNIDSQREIDWLQDLDTNKTYNLGIRVNFDLEACCPGHAQCPDEGGRFGFCYENGMLQQALERIADRGFAVKGLHLHTSTKTRALEVYKVLARKACEIAGKYNLELSFIDIGGGYFGGMPGKPQFADYISEISRIMQTAFRKEDVTLIVEPGMAVIGPCISYVTEVIDVKDTTYGRFVVTDGSRTDIDPLMAKKSYFYRVEYARDGGKAYGLQTVCGYTCMENDRLFRMLDTPELKVGDRIIYEKVGAYTMCLTPLFIQYFPSVYVEDGQEIYQVRTHWGEKEYCQGSCLGGKK